MADENTTAFIDKASILSDLWVGYKQDEQFSDFIEYNDLGMPLAYLIDYKIVEPTPLAETFINETWALFLNALDVEDTGFANLDEILGIEE